MKVLIALSLISIAAMSTFMGRFTRESNSRVAATRGIEAYRAGDFREAAEEFETASASNDDPMTAFDLGTSLIAEGETERGLETLGRVLDDPMLASVARYNRGNGALSQDRVEQAIEEYTEALRIDPTNVPAKRNLEIALERKREQQAPAPSESPGADQGAQPPGSGEQEGNELEALLRSVEQQEQEELRRMRRARGERRPIGW